MTVVSVPVVAVNESAPATVPSVQFTCASPLASVVTVVDETAPLVALGVNVTATPATGTPLALVISTTTGAESAVFTVAVCAPPLETLMALGVGGDVLSLSLLHAVAASARRMS